MLYYEGLRYGLCYGLCYRQRYRIALGLSYGRRYSLRPYTYMKNGVKIIILSNYAQPTMCSEICTCKIASRSFLVRWQPSLRFLNIVNFHNLTCFYVLITNLSLNMFTSSMFRVSFCGNYFLIALLQILYWILWDCPKTTYSQNHHSATTLGWRRDGGGKTIT